MFEQFFKWWHHIKEPHCVECAQERECKSCITLQLQLDQANREKEKLFELILEKNKPAEPTPQAVNLDPMKNRYIPWRVRQQLLENEDRERARILREQGKSTTSVEELEKEMDLAGEKREAEKANSPA